MLYIPIMIALISLPSLHSMHYVNALMEYTKKALPTSLTFSSESNEIPFQRERPSRRSASQPTTHPIVIKLLEEREQKAPEQDLVPIVFLGNSPRLQQEPSVEPKTIVLFEESTFTDPNDVDKLQILNQEEEKEDAILSQVKEDDENIPQNYVFFRGGQRREMPVHPYVALYRSHGEDDPYSQSSEVNPLRELCDFPRKYFEKEENIDMPGYEEKITLEKHQHTGKTQRVFLQKAFKSHLKNIEKKFERKHIERKDVKDQNYNFNYKNPAILMLELDSLHKTFKFSTKRSRDLHTKISNLVSKN